jgi:hypothetical protein
MVGLPDVRAIFLAESEGKKSTSHTEIVVTGRQERSPTFDSDRPACFLTAKKIVACAHLINQKEMWKEDWATGALSSWVRCADRTSVSCIAILITSPTKSFLPSNLLLRRICAKSPLSC